MTGSDAIAGDTLNGVNVEAIDRLIQGPLAVFFQGTPICDIGALTGEAEGLPEESFGTVYAGNQLQNITDYRGTLQRWFRALRVNGHLIISVPHAFLFERKLTLPSRWNSLQRRLYTPRSLLDEVEEALVPNSYRIRLLGDQDEGYDYDLPWSKAPVGGHDIVLVLEKIPRPQWDLTEPGEAKVSAPDFAFERGHTRVEVVSRVPRRRIAILKLDHLGDFIMGIPALERARAVFADAEITLVVGSWNLDMARDLGIADKVLAFDVFPRNSSEERVDLPGKTALFEALMKEEYDLAIDLRNDGDTRFLLKCIRAPVRAGMGTAAQFPYLDIFLPVDLTRHEPETARVDVLGHEMFLLHANAERCTYRVACARMDSWPERAIIWGPYLSLRAGRYIFEPFIELDSSKASADRLLLLDIALDIKVVSTLVIPAQDPLRLHFTVENSRSKFEFRVWPVDGAPTPEFSFYGGRLIREGANSVLHQSEYLSLLIDLIEMRASGTGLLMPWQAAQ